MLHKETVTPELLEVLKSLMSIEQLKAFQLVGGTAIALQLGHRKSVDIDLFSNQKADLRAISQTIRSNFPERSAITLTQSSISTFIRGVRVDIYDDWSIPFQRELVYDEEIRLSNLEDLAAFKLSTIIGRREKKDYIDLFFLFKSLDAAKVLTDFKTYEPLLSDKSLVFALAEVDTVKNNKSPMPDMLLAVDWKEIKDVMIEESRRFIQMKNNKI
jgi:Nucleotidyl transferase AbiEii toxin, Type IV TA system